MQLLKEGRLSGEILRLRFADYSSDWSGILEAYSRTTFPANEINRGFGSQKVRHTIVNRRGLTILDNRATEEVFLFYKESKRQC